MVTEDKNHSNKVRTTVNRDFAVDKSLSLKLLWELRLFAYKEQIEEFT